MLIECPECHNKISNQSNMCIHCGYPLKPRGDYMCCINGVEHDLSTEFVLLTESDFMQGLRNLRDKHLLNLSDATTLGNIIKNTKQIPREYNSSIKDEYRNQNFSAEIINIPKCPTCNSTNIEKISATSKVVGAVAFGLFSKTARSQFKCKNCGAKW